MYTNGQLVKYSKPLSKTERDHCESSVRVFELILEDFGFSVTKSNYSSNDDDLDFGFHVKKGDLTFTVLLQGSYGNGTCVRQDGDIDIAMICESTFKGNYPNGLKPSDYGFTNSSFKILEFKKELADFINVYYSCRNNNKCIDFYGNGTSRKDIDIVPSLRYRDYSGDYCCDETNYRKGVLIRCNDGSEIINYPEQNLINSKNKNKETNFYYKKIVRILKNMKHDLEDDGFPEAILVSSYGLESLVYNVPNNYFRHNSYYLNDEDIKDITKNVVNYLFQNRYAFDYYYEPNGINKIFDNKKNNIEYFRGWISRIKEELQ